MSNEVEVTTKSEKKKKKVKADENVQSTAERFKKKKQEQTDLTVDADRDDGTPKKRKKKRKHHDDDPNADVAEKESTKKRKKRKEDDTSLTSADISGEIEPERKSNSSNPDDTTREKEKDTNNQAEPVKKKSSKESQKSKKERRTERVSVLPNPEEDSILTDKARAALTYAYARVSSIDSWKFNKGLQNWIVKHFFILDTVPEKYVPIVVGYLARCQGGVREHLIETCKKHLEPTNMTSDTPTPAVSADTEQQTEASAGRTVKFQLPSETENDNPSRESDEALKTRANALLDALGHTHS